MHGTPQHHAQGQLRWVSSYRMLGEPECLALGELGLAGGLCHPVAGGTKELLAFPWAGQAQGATLPQLYQQAWNKYHKDRGQGEGAPHTGQTGWFQETAAVLELVGNANSQTEPGTLPSLGEDCHVFLSASLLGNLHLLECGDSRSVLSPRHLHIPSPGVFSLGHPAP